MKCVQLPSSDAAWVELKCQEGLIYDKNLRSCAIPGDDWECLGENEGEAEDESNVYGIDNLDDSEFLEVIDENLNFPESRGDGEDSSGDGEIPDSVTPSASTVRMITTQLQRLTQLMKHVQDKNDGVVDDDDVTPEVLNSFLATQKIQSDSPDYQKNDFHSSDKTPMPSSGRIHPAILTEILDQQSQLNSETSQLTTLSMDLTTPKPPKIKPTFYSNKDPFTEIKLKSGQNLDGTGSHQIVVNRPEGSVLFNVPSPPDQNQHSPYLSQDILKTILEISRQMVAQNQKQNPQASFAPQPFYYAVPIPMLSPQNNVRDYYNHGYQGNITEAPIPVVKKKPKPSKIQIDSSPFHQKVNEKADDLLSGYVDNFGFYHAPNAQSQSYLGQNSQQNYQNPNYYYQNYPGYTNGYQNQNYYSTYQFPSKNQFSTSNYDYDGSYYGNRPFVMESSAPSYVDHSIRQKPFPKESYATTFEHHEEDEVEDENLYDEVEPDESEEKPQKDELICSFVVQRQANKTDCLRYYVCNAKTKEVLSYTCPIFTAFNDQTKYCDSNSYPACKKVRDRANSNLKNQKIYDEAHKALAQVKKETQKVERIASMVRQESQKIYKRRNQFQNSYEPQQTQTHYQPSYEPQRAPTQYQPTFGHIQKIQKPLVRQQPPPLAVTKPRPSKKSSKKKKRKVKCRDVGNIVDPESSDSYWHCFKGSDGRMKRINKKCAQNFVFCPSTRYCTPENRC